MNYSPSASNATIDGAVLRFAFSGKEKDLETGLSYFGARYYDADLTTGWLSVDPMSDKYPSMSPYNYCAGNPVRLVDPDGMEIFYSEGRGEYYIYRKGQDGQYGLFNVNSGNPYRGGNEDYVNNLISALGKLQEGTYGSRLVDYFEGSDEQHVVIRKSTGKNRTPSGNIVEWNDQSSQDIPIASNLNDMVQSEKNTPFVSLGHEMAHVKDRYKHREKNGSEGTAMLFENLIRFEHGLNQRTYHGMKETGMVDFDSEPAPIIRLPQPNVLYGDPISIIIPYL